MSKESRWPEAIGTFALGVGIGAVVALLAAPKSGEDLRGDIEGAVAVEIREARKTGKRLSRQAQKVVDLAADRVKDVLDAGQNAFKEAKTS